MTIPLVIEYLPPIWLIPSLSLIFLPFGAKFISKVISSLVFFGLRTVSKKSSYCIWNPCIWFLVSSVKTLNLDITLRPRVFLVENIRPPSTNFPITSSWVLIISPKTKSINLLKFSFVDDFDFHFAYALINLPKVIYFFFGPQISCNTLGKKSGLSLEKKGPKHCSKRIKEDTSWKWSRTR